MLFRSAAKSHAAPTAAGTLAGRTSVSPAAARYDGLAGMGVVEEFEVEATDGLAIGGCVFCSAGAHETARPNITRLLIRVELIGIANSSNVTTSRFTIMSRQKVTVNASCVPGPVRTVVQNEPHSPVTGCTPEAPDCATPDSRAQ